MSAKRRKRNVRAFRRACFTAEEMRVALRRLARVGETRGLAHRAWAAEAAARR